MHFHGEVWSSKRAEDGPFGTTAAALSKSLAPLLSNPFQIGGLKRVEGDDREPRLDRISALGKRKRFACKNGLNANALRHLQKTKVLPLKREATGFTVLPTLTTPFVRYEERYIV